MAMVDEALRDPTTVGMLALNGEHLMKETGETPGPRIGWILHALLEEVLDDPLKNTYQYLAEKGRVLSKMEDSALRDMGEAGKMALERVEEAALKDIRASHHVD